jgi:hypothetical protein
MKNKKPNKFIGWGNYRIIKYGSFLLDQRPNKNIRYDYGIHSVSLSRDNKDISSYSIEPIELIMDSPERLITKLEKILIDCKKYKNDILKYNPRFDYKLPKEKIIKKSKISTVTLNKWLKSKHYKKNKENIKKYCKQYGHSFRIDDKDNLNECINCGLLFSEFKGNDYRIFYKFKE